MEIMPIYSQSKFECFTNSLFYISCYQILSTDQFDRFKKWYLSVILIGIYCPFDEWDSESFQVINNHLYFFLYK